jgi:AbiEi antitoxin C-terminal domain
MAVVPPIARIPRELRLLPFRGSDAIRAGLLTWGQLRHAAWRRLLPDVYIAADVEIDHRVRCRAALVYAGASRPGVAISGLSAAACWGVDLLPPGAPIEVTVPPCMRLDSRAGQVRLIRAQLRSDEFTTLGTITLTTPERTAFDVIRRSDRINGIAALDSLLNRRVVRMPALSTYRATIGRCPGSRVFADALEAAEPLAESPMETRSRLVLVDSGLPRPVAQHVIQDSSGRFVARVDLAYPVEQVALEYEGDHHRERDTFRRDIDRLNALIALDWVVVRATARDIYRDPDQLVRRVSELLRRRRI